MAWGGGSFRFVVVVIIIDDEGYFNMQNYHSTLSACRRHHVYIWSPLGKKPEIRVPEL